MDAEFECAVCYETNSTFVDPTGGASQQYVEDCQVCCHPNVLTISWDDELQMYLITARSELGDG